MPEGSFRAVSVPFREIEKLAISGGYSAIYPTYQPKVDIVGDWQQRYCSLADTFQPVLERVHNFDVRTDDVWVVTSTKCGTTWTQEMTWLILNDYNFEHAKAIDLTLRSPFLEFNGVVPNVPHDTIRAANDLDSPRLIKSHLPAWLLPSDLWIKKPKIIYVFRNPKDAAVSQFHHWRGMVGYQGSKEEFLNSYMQGHVNYNPFWPHVLDFWNLRDEPHIFFTSYERMKQNLGAVIADICRFLDKPIKTWQMHQLLDHLSFDKMQNNAACNHINEFESMKMAAGRKVPEFRFIRRGIVGSYKDEMPVAMVRQFDEWTDSCLKPHQLAINDFIDYSKF